MLGVASITMRARWSDAGSMPVINANTELAANFSDVGYGDACGI
jgi:hypothetical protein